MPPGLFGVTSNAIRAHVTSPRLTRRCAQFPNRLPRAQGIHAPAIRASHSERHQSKYTARRDLLTTCKGRRSVYSSEVTASNRCFSRRSRLALDTTLIEESAIAASAISGCSHPSIANGMATAL